MKEYRLIMNTNKTVTKKISRHLNTNIRITRITVNGTLVLEVGRFIYLGSEINSEGKINRSIEK
jgi:hypothetical protein